MADTILIIEDKDSMLDMLRQTLEAEGYQVIAGAGTEPRGSESWPTSASVSC